MANQRGMKRAVTAAVAAGVIAAGVAYLLYLRPEWRRHVVEVGRHLLNVAEGLVKRQSEEVADASAGE